jgi:hypothetical protein
VTTRGFLGTLSTRVTIEGTVLEGILQEGQ